MIQDDYLWVLNQYCRNAWENQWYMLLETHKYSIITNSYGIHVHAVCCLKHIFIVDLVKENKKKCTKYP
jgi:hypothetical protein